MKAETEWERVSSACAAAKIRNRTLQRLQDVLSGQKKRAESELTDACVT